jgi:glycosyltransferase involved in cell wall biosynthesis
MSSLLRKREISMNPPPRVSVIISFLNAERFIREAIESVFAQTFQKWEILLIDDGSTDGSVGISREYAAMFPNKLRYFEHDGHKNRGLPASRNVGVQHAKGEFIAVLDSDDVWLPRKLEEQVNILDSRPEVALVCGSTRYWFSWTETSEGVPKDYVRPFGIEPDRVYFPPSLIRARLAERIASPCPSDLLFRRETLLNIGGFEESFTGYAGAFEDQAVLAKVYLHAPVFVAKECWDKYRVHADSYCARVHKEGFDDSARFFYLRWLEEYVSRQGTPDAKLRSLLGIKLWAYRHPKLAGLLRPGWRAFRSLLGVPANPAGIQSVMRK